MLVQYLAEMRRSSSVREELFQHASISPPTARSSNGTVHRAPSAGSFHGSRPPVTYRVLTSPRRRKRSFKNRTATCLSGWALPLGVVARMCGVSIRVGKNVKSMKIDIIMITGDNQTTANAVAEKTGIHNVSAGVLPAGKSEEISGLWAAGRVVAMAGDGINDAPARIHGRFFDRFS